MLKCLRIKEFSSRNDSLGQPDLRKTQRNCLFIPCNVSVSNLQLFSISDDSFFYTAPKSVAMTTKSQPEHGRVAHDSVGLHQRLLSKSFAWNCRRAGPGAWLPSWSRVVPIGARGAAWHRGAVRELGTVHTLAQRDVVLLHWHWPATLWSNDVLHRNGRHCNQIKQSCDYAR